jgi:DnaJ family protein C protein 19
VVALILGLVALMVLMGALGAFSKAQVASVKQFGLWVAAIGGLLLAVLMFLTGREAGAIAGLTMLGPLLWSWLREAVPQPRPGGSARRSESSSGSGRGGRGPMSREEAYAVLGLAPGASPEAIRAAHKRLMRVAHPDQGGSDWLAARINQARDVLLG